MIFGFLKSHYPRQLKHKAAFLWLYFFVLAFVFLILASLQDEVSFLFSQPPIALKFDINQHGVLGFNFLNIVVGCFAEAGINV
jgi:hypothetical protein